MGYLNIKNLALPRGSSPQFLDQHTCLLFQHVENPGCDMEIKLLKYGFNFDGISSQVTAHKTCLLNEIKLCKACFKEGFRGCKNGPSFISKFTCFS